MYRLHSCIIKCLYEPKAKYEEIIMGVTMVMVNPDLSETVEAASYDTYNSNRGSYINNGGVVQIKICILADS